LDACSTNQFEEFRNIISLSNHHSVHASNLAGFRTGNPKPFGETHER
jgi:hypothetical protein